MPIICISLGHLMHINIPFWGGEWFMHTRQPIKTGKHTNTGNPSTRAMHFISLSLVGKTTVKDGEVTAKMDGKLSCSYSSSP